MQNNLVSIAMATYNGEKYLKEQLDSIYNQTYKNIEVIVCDDCSSDKTIDILEKYSQHYGLKYLINQSNLGFKKNFEKVIGLCKGEYILLSDQDDIWVKEKIEILLENISNYSLVHSACSLIDENTKEISPLWVKEDDFTYTFEKFIFGNTVTGCTVLFKRELLRYAFPIPSGEMYHDWWLALLATKMNGIVYCDDILVKYRQHVGQNTGIDDNTFKKKIIRFYDNLISKKNSERYKGAMIQTKRLNSFINERKEIFNQEEQKIILESIEYYEKYINSFFHLKSFIISLKYSKYIYPKNLGYLKNLLKDIIG